MISKPELEIKLDELDEQIIALLEQRMELAAEIASCRLDRSLVLSDEQKDQALIAKASESGEQGGYVAEIYKTVLRCGREQQAEQFGIELPRVIDISRELLSSHVYPGDPIPELRRVGSISEGRNSNLSALSMCVHNSTHVDAPLHFVDGAGDILTIAPDVAVGRCLVVDYDHDVTADDIRSLPAGTKRLLVKGGVFISPEGAKAIADSELLLIGVEPQSVAPAETSCEVHRTMLGAGRILVEGLDLQMVCPGEYTLSAMPLKIAGSEGAPCRAVLICD